MFLFLQESASDTEENASDNPSEKQEDITNEDYQNDFQLEDTSLKEESFVGIILKNVLHKTGTGKALLKKKALNSEDRKKLVLQIAEHLLATEKKGTRQIFEFWSVEISSIFVNEKEETYYLHAKPPTRKNSSGLLFNKFNNLKKYIRKELTKDLIDKEDENEYLKQTDVEILNKLRTITSEHTELIKLWQASVEYLGKGSSIEQYFNIYPVLRTQIGAELVNITYLLKISE